MQVKKQAVIYHENAKNNLGIPKKKSTFHIQQGLQRKGNIFERKMMKSGVNAVNYLS